MSDAQTSRRQRDRQRGWKTWVDSPPPLWAKVGGLVAVIAGVFTIATGVQSCSVQGGSQASPVASQAPNAASQPSSTSGAGNSLTLVETPGAVKDLDDVDAAYRIDTGSTAASDNDCLAADIASWARTCLLVISDENVEVPAVVGPLNTFTVAGVIENTSDDVERLSVRVEGSAPLVCRARALLCRDLAGQGAPTRSGS